MHPKLKLDHDGDNGVDLRTGFRGDTIIVKSPSLDVLRRTKQND
jgi:hypothetical protein